ncbi:hypothetical protein TNCT_580701 [Trichonephila clavata]|uniref:Uncharacterized protein n=1 Tax=Trichonephila clavata TaxID=2740835 RepID=A0A8X6J9A8_TRICU|nr:hypothetical protein TNCT_580701 [Trichonephila clavata]
MFFVIPRLHLYTSRKKISESKGFIRHMGGMDHRLLASQQKEGEQIGVPSGCVTIPELESFCVVSFLLWWSGMSGCYADSSVKHLMRPQKEGIH